MEESLDDGIEPLVLKPKENDNVFYPMLGHQTQVDSLLAQAINIKDDGVLYEATCPICSSSHREAIEEKYDENQSDDFNLGKKDKIKTVLEYVNEITNLDISRSVLENHFKFHHNKGLREIQKREYVERIKRYTSQNLTTMDRISICFAIISERLMGINSIVAAGDENESYIEKLKSNETSRLMGALSSLLKLQASILGEMKDKGELITIPTNDFVRIMNSSFASCSTDSERKIVKKIFDRFETLSKQMQ